MGEYGKYTRQKLSDFEDILAHHINICQRIQSRYQLKGWRLNPYFYLDVFAGRGIYDPDGEGKLEGSPIIAKRLLKNSDIDYHLWAIEQDFENYLSLCDALGKTENIINGDSFEQINQIKTNLHRTFGMVFIDCDMGLHNIQASFDLIKSAPLFKSPKLDVMIYLSGQWYKRNRYSEKFIHLSEVICDIPKKYKVIRELKGQQFTFLIFTNYAGWANWGGAGWYPIDSPSGHKQWEKLIYFEDELKKKYQPYLTGLIENTYNTLSLEQLGHKQLSDPAVFAKDVGANL